MFCPLGYYIENRGEVYLDSDLSKVCRAYCRPFGNRLGPLLHKRACRRDRTEVGRKPLDAPALLIDCKKDRALEFLERERLGAGNKVFQLLPAFDVSFEKDNTTRTVIPDKVFQLLFEAYSLKADKKMNPRFAHVLLRPPYPRCLSAWAIRMRLAPQRGRSADTIPIPKLARAQNERVFQKCIWKTGRSVPALLEKTFAAG